MGSHEHTSSALLKSFDYYLSEESTGYGSSNSETDSNIAHSLSDNHHLHASIASIPEDRLREIMVKMVNKSPGFKHAFAKELLSPYIPSASPRRKPRKSKRPGSSDTITPERKCGKCGKYIKHGNGHTLPHGKCAFHPGHLKEEAYEFLSRTPEGRTLNVVRAITMWSCCDEDAWTPGCATALAHQFEE